MGLIVPCRLREFKKYWLKWVDSEGTAGSVLKDGMPRTLWVLREHKHTPKLLLRKSPCSGHRSLSESNESWELMPIFLSLDFPYTIAGGSWILRSPPMNSLCPWQIKLESKVVTEIMGCICNFPSSPELTEGGGGFLKNTNNSLIKRLNWK